MRPPLALAVLLATLTAACGDPDRDAPASIPDAGAGDARTDGSAWPLSRVHVEFAPGAGAPLFGAVPFPSDLFLDAEGHVQIAGGLERVATTNASILASGLGGTEGFARQGSGVFFVDGELDAASLPGTASVDADASVVLADVDPASPALGTRYPLRARYLPSLSAVTAALLPGVVLPPGVRHALVVTRRVRDREGSPLGPSPELRRIAMLPAGERSSPSERLHGDALDALVAEKVIESRSDVAGLAVFTTSRAWEVLHALRARLRSGEFPAPEAIWDTEQASPARVAIFGSTTTPSLDDWLGTAPRDERGVEWPGGDDPAGIAHDAIGAVASFAMAVPSFLDATTGHFEDDGTGGVRLAAAANVMPVTIVVPKAEPPAAGYPVIVHGHGLSNDRGSMLSNANELARAGFAVIGIDDVQHGVRQGLADETSRFPGAWKGPDGIPDTLPFAVAFLGGFVDFLATRDNFRQTILDQVSLVRLVQNPALDLAPLSAARGGGPARLDGSRIVWSGGSLGGIVGSMVAGVEPELRAAAFQVPGAGFIPFVVSESAQLSGLVETIANTNFAPPGAEPLDELHPLGLLLGQITEAGDPLAYAGGVLGARPAVSSDPRRPHVLVSYTVDDEVLPNLATHALIRALGVPLAGPVLVTPDAIPQVGAPVTANLGGRTGAAVQYAPSMHALGYNRWDTRQFQPGFPASDPQSRFPRLPMDVRIELPIREHTAALVTFLAGALDGAPTVEITAPVRRDYDADGIDDDAERAAGTNPWDPASR